MFTSSNVLFGIIGYWITALSIKRKPRGDHHWVWCHCYNAFNAILGLGYYRFTYAGNWADWQAGKQYTLFDFLSCETFYTLIVMAVVFIPSCGIPLSIFAIRSWDIRGNGRQEAWRWVFQTATHATYGWFVVMWGWGIYCLIVGQEGRAKIHNGWWSPWIGYTIAQCCIFGIFQSCFLFAIMVGLAKDKQLVRRITTKMDKV